MRFREILNENNLNEAEEFSKSMFLNDYLDYYWYWLGAGKRLSGLSGNSTAQKKSDNLYEKYNDYIDVYRFEEYILDIHEKHIDELDKEYPNIKKYDGTKMYDIKSAPILFDKMKKFLDINGTEIVKKNTLDRIKI